MRTSMDTIVEKEEEEDPKVNWVDLPDHLIASITDKLVSFRDYVRFGAVCRSWRSVYIDNLDRRPLSRLPLLMVPSSNALFDKNCSLYSISDNAVIPDMKIPIPKDWYCRGSSEGWLITIHENRIGVRLLHPFSLAEIKLPPTTALNGVNEIDEYGDEYGVYLKKVILSADPSLNPNYIVMVIYGQHYQLALFNPCDPTWTPLDSSFKNMHDVVYWRDRFYAVDSKGQIYACDPKHPNPQLVKVAHPPDECNLVDKQIYLVVSDGDLLLIARSWGYYSSGKRTRFVEVFKLKQGSSPTTLTLTWTPLQSLRGQALFLGSNSSLSVLAFDFPGCRPDCIYFTDRDQLGHAETRDHLKVFNFAKGTIEQHYTVIDRLVFFDVPTWIQHNQPCNNNKVDSSKPPQPQQQQQSCHNLSFSHS